MTTTTKQEITTLLFDVADRMRRTGCPDRTKLNMLCEAAVTQGVLSIDDAMRMHRHLGIHAGIITTDHGRFRVCPECEAILDVPDDLAG